MRRQAMLAAASAAVILAFTAPEASSVDVRSTAGLNSGTYQVVVVTAGGKSYHSLWRLQVVSSRITGDSEWDCCPGHRVDKLEGSATNEGVSITRTCTGQGQPGPCQQVYTSGPPGTSRLEGRWSGTGGSGRWTLYLDRVDIKFTARAGGGTAKGILLDDAQLLGGGKAVDLKYNNYAEKVTAVFALRLQYTGGPEVRVSLRVNGGTGVLSRVSNGSALFVRGLEVFQSNAPKGRTRYGCPQVGVRAALVLAEQESGDVVRLALRCPGVARDIRWDAGEAAVTLTPIHGHT